ncbi:TPA: RimK family alpha-L-glutamate ligase [archaeon]|nr:RimK family alpha-L-glutamate ligase [Candidatus Naiadarchaeales archaeon SRR2090153.bin461]
MRIGILSSNPESWRMQQFARAARKLRVRFCPINPLDTKLEMKDGKFLVRHPELDLTTLASSIHGGNRKCFPYILHLLDHMEGMGIPLTANSLAVWKTRNKFVTLQECAKAGLRVPDTFLTYSQDLALMGMDKMHMPVVIKLLESSSGRGIMKAQNIIEVEGLTGTLKALDQLIFAQEYVNSPGVDYRVFVVGGEIIGAMKRKGRKGMWKANIAVGGRGYKINLDSEKEEMALKTAEVLNTGVAGVDIIEDERGPMILEANITPGFEGLVKYTGINPAPKIIEYAKSIAKK